MKIRGKDELIEFLATSKKCRKRELISLVSELKSASTGDIPRIGRAALLLAYAHWEGFVKDAASAYVYLVARKSRQLSDLMPCFQALACRQEFSVAQSASRRILPHINVVQRLTDRLNEAFSIDAETVIDTESNLNELLPESILYNDKTINSKKSLMNSK